MSANHAAFNLIFRFVENYVSPIAGRIFFPASRYGYS